MKGKIFILMGLLVVCFLFINNACDSQVEEVQRADENKTAATFQRLKQAVPPPEMTDSLERHQLVERLSRLNDPDHIYYIYLVNRGIIMAELVLKGKVSSVNSKLTCTQQTIYKGNGAMVAVESPALDGSYGSNGDAVFFFLTDGTMIEWSGVYLLADRQFKLSQRPLLVAEVSDIK